MSRADARNTLTLRREPDGLRYYLDDEPIHAGEALEMQLDDGAWTRGRYEYSIHGNTISARLCLKDDKAIRIDPERHAFRWPETQRSRRFR